MPQRTNRKPVLTSCLRSRIFQSAEEFLPISWSWIVCSVVFRHSFNTTGTSFWPKCTFRFFVVNFTFLGQNSKQIALKEPSGANQGWAHLLQNSVRQRGMEKEETTCWTANGKRSDFNCLWVINALPRYFKVSTSLFFLLFLLCAFQFFPLPFSLTHLYLTVCQFSKCTGEMQKKNCEKNC